MTLKEIREKVAAGREKARQRRGASDKLGISRTRTMMRPTEVEVSRPRTEDEIIDRIRSGREKAAERRQRVLARRMEAKEAAAKIREKGYQLDYEMLPGRGLSLAYKIDKDTNAVDLYFAVRSPKDAFSRNAARKAILEHMAADTHHVTFTAESLEREELFEQVSELIFERFVEKPEEFPNIIVERMTAARELRARLMKMVEGNPIMAAIASKLGEQCDCPDCRAERRRRAAEEEASDPETTIH